MKVKQPTKTVRRLVPESDYQATLSTIKPFSNAYEDRLAFAFTITDGPYTGAIIEQATASKFTPSSKLANLVGKLLGRRLTVQDFSEGVDLDCLIGTVCRVTIVHRTDRAGTPYAEVAGVIVVDDLNGQKRQRGETNAQSSLS